MRTTLWTLMMTLPLAGLACGDKDDDTGTDGWGDGGGTDGGGADGGGTDGGGTDGGGTDGGGTDGGGTDGGGTDGGGTDGGGTGDGGGDGGTTEPINLLVNGNFEAGWESWAIYPESLSNYAIINTGDPIYLSDETFVAGEGSRSLKVYGQFTGWQNETPIYQSFAGKAGQTYTLTGWVYHHPDDAIQGTTYGSLAIKFFTADYSGFDLQESEYFLSSSPTGTWTELTVTGEVPEGFTIVQAAIQYWHCYGEAEGDCYDGGAMYIDDLVFSLAE